MKDQSQNQRPKQTTGQNDLHIERGTRKTFVPPRLRYEEALTKLTAGEGNFAAMGMSP
jgi:hypothetical protein